MNCNQNSRLYIKANGEVPCFCATGENKILHMADEKTDFVNEILLGEKYNHIRGSFKKGVMPWPEFCPQCLFLDKDSPFCEILPEERKVTWIQLEPSFLCNINCNTCVPIKHRKLVKSPPYNISFDLVKKLVDNLYGAGYSVGHFNFQGRGEPLMNKDVWKMVSYAREFYPDSKISLNTNGNFKYTDDLVTSGLSQLMVAVDGCYQDSYQMLRNGGKIDKAFRFMQEISEGKARYEKELEVVWQYAMFGHNDSDRELMDAQKKAMELGIDLLDFDITFWVGSKLKHSRFGDIKEILKFPFSEPINVSIRTSFPDLFSKDNLMKIMDRAKLDELKSENIKSIIIFGTAPLGIVDSCLESISESMPGLSVDLLSCHNHNPSDYGINLNVIPFKVGVNMSEATVDMDKLKHGYDLGVICSTETMLFPDKLNVLQLASKAGCAKTLLFVGRDSLYFMKNGAKQLTSRGA